MVSKISLFYQPHENFYFYNALVSSKIGNMVLVFMSIFETFGEKDAIFISVIIISVLNKGKWSTSL